MEAKRHGSPTRKLLSILLVAACITMVWTSIAGTPGGYAAAKPVAATAPSKSVAQPDATHIPIWIAQVPSSVMPTDTVRIWMNSDTAFGESACVEYHINTTYTKICGTYDDTGYPGANWRADIPAQPGGTYVEYQLFVRDTNNQDIYFTGFNWRYTVNQVGDNVHTAALLHDSFDANYRSPFGAVYSNTQVTLRFRTEATNVQTATLRVYQAIHPTNPPATDYNMNLTSTSGGYDYWTAVITTPHVPDLLYYRFKAEHVRANQTVDAVWYNDNYVDDHDNVHKGGDGVFVVGNEPSSAAYQLTVYDPAFTTPDWVKNGVIYQIMPDRFRDGNEANDQNAIGQVYYGGNCQTGGAISYLHSTWNEPPHDGRTDGCYNNDHFGGDLQGIQQEIPYLKSLGVTVLYLMPIFKARSNHRYDTDDYLQVDPILGTNQDFVNLTTAAHANGIKIVLDGVFNHASSDGLYFDRYHRYTDTPPGACESDSSPYHAWYLFSPLAGGPCVNNTETYQAWFGFDSLAVSDKNNANYRDFIYRDPMTDVIKYWYGLGADGWRFDVADDQSFTDAHWWQDFRPYAKQYNPDGVLFAERWPNASAWLLGDQMDSTMNYRFKKNILGFTRYPQSFTDNDLNGSNTLIPLKPSEFDHAMQAIREDYPLQAQQVMMNLLDSHDNSRALYVLHYDSEGSDLTNAKQRLRMAATFQFTYLGAPTIYYGDEAGLYAPDVPDGNGNLQDDPYNRAPYPWSDTPGTYTADPQVLAYYTQLSYIRAQHPALRTGSFSTLLTDDTNMVYSFGRADANEKLVVVMNNDTGSHNISVPVSSFLNNGQSLHDELAGGDYTVTGGLVTINLAGKTSAILATNPAGPQPTATPTGSPTPTRTQTPTVTGTPPTATPTLTPLPTNTETATPTATSTPDPNFHVVLITSTLLGADLDMSSTPGVGSLNYSINGQPIGTGGYLLLSYNSTSGFSGCPCPDSPNSNDQWVANNVFTNAHFVLQRGSGLAHQAAAVQSGASVQIDGGDHVFSTLYDTGPDAQNRSLIINVSGLPSTPFRISVLNNNNPGNGGRSGFMLVNNGGNDSPGTNISYNGGQGQVTQWLVTGGSTSLSIVETNASSSGNLPVGGIFLDDGDGSGATFTPTPLVTNTPTAGPATATSTPGSPTPTLCPIPFTDINGNVFYQAITVLYCRGVVNGVDATHYSPAGTSTRAQFAKVVVLGFAFEAFTPNGGIQDFTDVPPTYFAYQFIETGYHANILNGYDTASCLGAGAQPPCYLPNRPINRGELTKLVVNAGGFSAFTPTSPTFTDVPPSYVFYASIETAHHYGIINGYPDNTFRPNNFIRRDEMAQIVYKGITTPPLR